MLQESVTAASENTLSTAELTDPDRVLLDRVEQALADGLALKQWWERTDATNAYTQRFSLVRAFNPPDESTGFFDNASLPRGSLPVMGSVEDLSYDSVLATSAE